MNPEVDDKYTRMHDGIILNLDTSILFFSPVANGLCLNAEVISFPILTISKQRRKVLYVKLMR